MARAYPGLTAALVSALWMASAAMAAPEAASLGVGYGERLLVVAPHPDDETLGAGGLIQRVRARGGEVRILVITAGDGWIDAVRSDGGGRKPAPSQFVAYGERRLQEVRAAALALGPHRLELQVLGFPDGGLDAMLGPNWQHAERSKTTGAADPPYDEALHPDVPYAGADLRRALEQILWEFRPTMIALPDPLDRHPDHRATGLFTLVAVDDWAERAAGAVGVMPRLLAYLVHWPAWPPGWDRAPEREDARLPLPWPPDFRAGDGAKTQLSLSPQEVARKGAALAQHKTQHEAMGSYLEAFVRRSEPFVVLDRSERERAEYVVAERQRTTHTR